MTPERLTGLAALLLELRDWLEISSPDCLDAALVDAVVSCIARQHMRLVQEGAR
jgi:hypothetical protein